MSNLYAHRGHEIMKASVCSPEFSLLFKAEPLHGHPIILASRTKIFMVKLSKFPNFYCFLSFQYPFEVQIGILQKNKFYQGLKSKDHGLFIGPKKDGQSVKSRDQITSWLLIGSFSVQSSNPPHDISFEGSFWSLETHSTMRKWAPTNSGNLIDQCCSLHQCIVS